MKKKSYKFILLILTLFLSYESLSANCLNDFCPETCFSNLCSDIRITGQVSYFLPASKRVKRIYGHGWADYNLELSKKVYSCFHLWASVNGFSKKGHSIGFHDSTRLQLIPVSFGLKYIHPFTCNFEGYLALGPSYSFLRIKDHSYYVIQHISKEGWGCLGQCGFNYYVYNCFFLNAFVDYYYQRFSFHHHDYSYYTSRNDLNMSGWKFGGGIGYRF